MPALDPGTHGAACAMDPRVARSAARTRPGNDSGWKTTSEVGPANTVAYSRLTRTRASFRFETSSSSFIPRPGPSGARIIPRSSGGGRST